jgi:hypothetical protein
MLTFGLDKSQTSVVELNESMNLSVRCYANAEIVRCTVS